MMPRFWISRRHLGAFLDALRLCAILQTLVFTIFPVAYAIPSIMGDTDKQPDFGQEDANSGASSLDPSSTLSSSGSPSASASPSGGSNSRESQLTDAQLGILLGVIGGVLLSVCVILFVRQRRRKLATKSRLEKEEDREPLSASFQPGELPTLPYWPEARSPPPPPGVA